MALSNYSETNVANTLATSLATRLLAENYLVYWHEIDAMQTPDGWYFNYSQNDATYLADLVFAPRVQSARGILTLARSISADRRFPVRPNIDGSIDGQGEVPLPWLVLEVGAVENGDLLEIGTRLFQRWRNAVFYGATRTPAEQVWVRDKLAEWFDEALHLDVLDHDAGTLSVVGSVEIVAVTSDSEDVVLGPESTRFEFLHEARLEFVA